ncbi:MAG: hypothetical protein K6E84_00455 [Lachnospiraceae bacterium]|nr:hypothetical protein [Lachnospiraceae bacterium]
MKVYDDMKKQLLEEPELLKQAMADAASPKEIYGKLRERLRRNMDTGVDDAKKAEEAEARREKSLLTDAEDIYILGKKDNDYLKKTRKELKELYVLDGKFRSEYAEKLYKKLDRVIRSADQNDGIIPQKEINSLKNKALVYYDKRKGVLMGPITDKGKARLKIVENLAHRLDRISIQANIRDADRNMQNNNRRVPGNHI